MVRAAGFEPPPRCSKSENAGFSRLRLDCSGAKCMKRNVLSCFKNGAERANLGRAAAAHFSARDSYYLFLNGLWAIGADPNEIQFGVDLSLPKIEIWTVQNEFHSIFLMASIAQREIVVCVSESTDCHTFLNQRGASTEAPRWFTES